MISVEIPPLLLGLLLSMVAGTPLLMAFFAFSPLAKTVSRFLPSAAVPALLVAVTAPLDQVVEVPWFFMGGQMGLDESGRIFLCLAAFIWLLAAFNSRSFLLSGRNRNRYLLFFLMAMAGNFGLILARGMLGYYLFFALMSFSAYGLVVHRQSSDAIQAGRIYLILLMIGEVALFTAFLLLVPDSGSLAIADLARVSPSLFTVVLLFVGFGVKIGVLPFHGWMIPAYRVTPLPAAAALAGSMVNAGILGWLRFLPPGQVVCPRGAWLFIFAGALAAIYGVVSGLRRREPAAVLGGSSISQMGLITVLFGLALLDENGGLLALPAVILYAVHHSLAKSSLFFACDLVQWRDCPPSRLQMVLITLSALSLAGLPLTSGAIAKTAFKGVAAGLGEPWYGLSTFFLPLTAMATTLLMLHLLQLLKSGKGIPSTGEGGGTWVFGLSLVALITVLWLWPAAGNAAARSLEGWQIIQGVWPMGAGYLLFFAWQRSGKEMSNPRREDSLWLRILSQASGYVPEKISFPPGVKSRIVEQLDRLSPQLRRLEKVMGRWKVVGISYLTLCLCLLLLLFNTR